MCNLRDEVFSLRRSLVGSLSGLRCAGGASILLATLLSFGSPLYGQVAFNGVVTTLGTGSTTLSAPAGIAVDPSGIVYIANTGSSQIVKISGNGTATVLAITGLGTALSLPNELAVDGAGNLYIADTGNSRIVEVSPSGVGSVLSLGSITLSAPKGLALDAAGDIFIADTADSRIVKLPAGGSAAVYTVTGLSPVLDHPIGLAIDLSGNLYIADSGNSRMVEVTSAGAGSALTITGVTPTLPIAVTVDSSGVLDIADSGGSQIVEVTTSGVGSNVSSKYGLSVSSPKGIAKDVYGNLYIADTSHNAVESIQQTSFGFGHVQLGSASGTTIMLPVTVQSGTDLTSLIVTTQGGDNLDFTVGDGTCSAGTYDPSMTCTLGVFFQPVAPGFRRGGVVLSYLTGSTPSTLTIPVYGFVDAPEAALSPGAASVISSGATTIPDPYQIAKDGSGNIYVASYTGAKVVKIPTGGGTATTVSIGSYPSLGEATGVVVDGAGNLFFSDYSNNFIYEVSASNVISQLTVTAAGFQIVLPTALAMDAVGNLFIADYGRGRVVKVHPPDIPQGSSPFSQSLTGTVVDTGGYTFVGSTITGLTVDTADNLYITDRTASRIIKVTPTGSESTVAVPGFTLEDPQGVAVDGMGNLYIADSGNNRIIEITVAGVTSVLQLQGLTSPTTIGNPFGVFVDALGNVYIPDWTNGRIVKVNVGGASLSFANTNRGSTSSDSPRTATVTNLGNEALVLSASPAYTSSFSENSGDTNLCTSTTSLSAGSACDVSVKFTPQSVGSLSANLTVTDDTLNVAGTTQQIAVSGISLNPGDTTTASILVTPSPVPDGQSATIAVTIHDTATGDTSMVPTGAVTLTDTFAGTVSSLNAGSPVTLSGGIATLSKVPFSGIGTHTITASYAAVEGSFLATSSTVSLTVSPATAAMSLVSSANPALLTAPVTFTVSLASALGTPTGLVSFYDGKTLLGTATLASGTASYTTSSMAVGTHSVTISYGGSSSFAAAVSPTLAEVIQDYTIGASGGSGSTGSTQTIAPGGTATYALEIGPSSGETLPAAVTLSVTGLPPGATATLSPKTLPAGSSLTKVALKIALPAAIASSHPDPFRGGRVPLTLAVLLLPFAATLRRASRRLGHGTGLVLLLLGGAAILAGCGGGSKPKTTNPLSYTITITATSGSLQHTTTVTLLVSGS